MIDKSVFDYVDEVVGELNSNDRDDESSIAPESTAIVFLEALFDQFFAQNSQAIVGTSKRAKRKAGSFAEALGEDPANTTVRKLLVAFEEFCDLSSDIQGSYGEGAATFERAYPLVARTLEFTAEWLDSIGEPQLGARSTQALHDFQAAQ